MELLKAKSISLSNGTTLWNGCSYILRWKLVTLTNGSTLHAAYIKDKTIKSEIAVAMYIFKTKQ